MVSLQGKAGVYNSDRKLADLVTGDYFGEAALLKSAPRMATVTAEEDLNCFVLTRELFVSFFGKDKLLDIQFAKRVAVSAEQYVDDGSASSADIVREKSV